jgi:hypothetical protein
MTKFRKTVALYDGTGRRFLASSLKFSPIMQNENRRNLSIGNGMSQISVSRPNEKNTVGISRQKPYCLKGP